MKIVASSQIPEPVSALPTGSEAKPLDRPARQTDAFAQDDAGVSALTAKLTDLRKALDVEERANVEHIRSEYQMGAYIVDSAKVSRAIVNDCLAALALPERAGHI